MVAVGLEQLEFLERFQLATKRLAGCRGSLGGGAGRAVYSDSGCRGSLRQFFCYRLLLTTP